MKNTVCDPERILSQTINGFHQYVLTDPVHLGYVSENFCQMVGMTERELLREKEDVYVSLVHPADRMCYQSWIRQLRAKEQTLTKEYRLIRKDGQVLFVRDTITSRKTEDGILVGDSVLTDITELKQETHNLQFLNETIPCGFVKYTCESQPRVTYFNQQMLDLLGFSKEEGKLYDLELYQNNIFLMIPMEERRKFALYLNRVYTAGVPIAGELTLLRCDGTRIYVFGWVTKCVNEQGVEEFQSVCMDVTERHRRKKASEVKRYLEALTDVYDKIFECNQQTNLVKCLYSTDSPRFKWLENIPMAMEDAISQLIAGTVVEEHQERMLTFFRELYQNKTEAFQSQPPQITYLAYASSGEIRPYRGIVLSMDESVCLFCCRYAPELGEAVRLKNENVSLKENMRELVMEFTDGLAAFEVKDEWVTPLYVSDNVCDFFGLTKEEWLSLMQKSTPIQEFVKRSQVAYMEFEALLRNGEGEFTYFDLKTRTKRQIKAICSQKSSNGKAPRYVMLYNVKATETGNPDNSRKTHTVSIRTFGYFDVFVDEKPIAFRSQKAKELFALLVDRRGGYVSSEEAISFLWEDEMVNSVTLSRYRKVALRLKNILEEYGISYVVEVVDGKRRIVTGTVQCDLYQYLSDRKEYAQLFHGSYLTNYSWGETTLGELTGTFLFGN
ncbi:MAG: PAS domain S-box protein [Lachnospiraceae bacterium]|nr:PAS domain S-box protein [Lachnospiraceae bacterium]